ncbi:MAG: hypothetical protein QM757_15385 [Paludibaculum sp.]
MDSEDVVRRAIGGDDLAVMIERKDGRGAAFGQEPELLFGAAAQFLLQLEARVVSDDDAPVAAHLIDQQAHAGIGQEGHGVAEPELESAVLRGKQAAQEGANGRDGYNLPSIQRGSRYGYGKNVEDSE